MSTATRVALSRALEVADELVARLAPGWRRIEIAGSIRRGRADVGDVELVAVPRLTPIQNLFGERIGLTNELLKLRDALLAEGILAPHPTDPKMGDRYSKLVHVASGLQVDLFSARPESFGLIYLIRTGPATYSQWLVTEARRQRHHVAGGELHRGAQGCDPRAKCEVVATPEERDVYTALAMPWIDPAERGL